ncbi:SGNH/GDSL hydrolase family protein [Stenotrophomonas mori]|uniref:SGNH/GDSL hydrolase family protein n=1 Tax=Stenotrophomonas mori TaxID=2871096 RepID=A0ABT0SIK3_9GAMM|nr:SGNH/GDSL hydrolase family protein [Stenotrophomonas mori]MCL7715087.1 SGNH/GDSL hydrolase family protein [Stenotrophomonas mori]
MSSDTPLPPAPRYLALGDSYTVGEGVGADGSWPFQLAAALRGHGIALDGPEVVATTGWTTDELAAAIDAAPPQGPYALVSLLVGVNNQYRGRPLAEYRQQFEQLLQRAIALAAEDPRRVLVLSFPDWGVTPYAAASERDPGVIARETDDFNAAARACCGDYNVAFVDITPLSRAHGAEPAMLAEDGLHPSAAMYRLWTREVLPVAAGQLADAGGA